MEELEKELHNWLTLPYNEQVWIPKSNMSVGYYLCKARNFTVGKWNGVEFEYMRTKFNSTFPDTEYHWDDGSPHGTVRPIRALSPKEILI